jgi:hypothetical protein
MKRSVQGRGNVTNTDGQNTANSMNKEIRNDKNGTTDGAATTVRNTEIGDIVIETVRVQGIGTRIEIGIGETLIATVIALQAIALTVVSRLVNERPKKTNRQLQRSQLHPFLHLRQWMRRPWKRPHYSSCLRKVKSLQQRLDRSRSLILRKPKLSKVGSSHHQRNPKACPIPGSRILQPNQEAQLSIQKGTADVSRRAWMSETEEELLAAAIPDVEARGLRKTVMGAREKYQTDRENVLRKTNYLFAISGRATAIEAIGQIAVAGAVPSLEQRMIGIGTAILSEKIAITTGSIGIGTGTGKGREIVRRTVIESGGQTVTGIAAGTTGIETMTVVEIEAGTAVAIVTALETGIEIGTIVIDTVGGIATTLGHAHVRARLREIEIVTGTEKETETSPGNEIGRASVTAIETETGHETETREETEKGTARRTETRSGRGPWIKKEIAKRKEIGSGTGPLKRTRRGTKIENVGGTESESRPHRLVVAPARGDALQVSLISIAMYP